MQSQPLQAQILSLFPHRKLSTAFHLNMSVQAFLPPPFTLTRARRSPRPCFSRVPRMSAKMPSPESSVISTQKVKGGLRLLEAPGSIFGALVQTARFAWNGGWKIMMAEYVLITLLIYLFVFFWGFFLWLWAIFTIIVDHD